MMQTKFKCPQCRAGYSITVPNIQAMASKVFRCPKCGFTQSFGQLLKIGYGTANPQMKTHIGGAAAGAPGFQGGKTHLGQGASMPLASLNIPALGKTFPLSQGVYTLGRDSSDSRATLKLAPDPYMSRQQARIEIMGPQLPPRCRIINLSATNPVMVNNRQISSNEWTNLKSGDTLLLGNTVVKIIFH